MENIKNHQTDTPISSPDEDFGSRVLSLLHPGLIVVISLVLAGGLFLTETEIRLLSGGEAATFKLAAGGVLIALIGMFFSQTMTFRQHYTQMNLEFERGFSEFEAMKTALKKRIESNSSETPVETPAQTTRNTAEPV